MATVGKSKYGVAVEYTSGAKTKFWFQTETARNNAYDREKKNVGTKWRYVKKVQR